MCIEVDVGMCVPEKQKYKKNSILVHYMVLYWYYIGGIEGERIFTVYSGGLWIVKFKRSSCFLPVSDVCICYIKAHFKQCLCKSNLVNTEAF